MFSKKNQVIRGIFHGIPLIALHNYYVFIINTSYTLEIKRKKIQEILLLTNYAFTLCKQEGN